MVFDRDLQDSHSNQWPCTVNVEGFATIANVFNFGSHSSFTKASSTILTANDPQPEHCVNHSLSVNSAPFVIKCNLRPSP
jgi:hypothetical protein